TTSLVEPAVERTLSVPPLPATACAPASHDREAVAFLQFLHLLRGNVIRNKALCRTFCTQFRQVIIGLSFLDVILLRDIDQLREGRSHPDACFVFNALVTLF